MRRARPYSQSRENLPRNYYCDHKAEYVVALHCGVMGPLLIHINECRRSSGMSLCVCTAVGPNNGFDSMASLADALPTCSDSQHATVTQPLEPAGVTLRTHN